VITIAGEPLEAELPSHVQAGQELRLVVRSVSAERVVLGLADQVPNPQASEVPLPGGGTIRIAEDDPRDDPGGGGARPGTHTLTLRYDAPALGAVDLRFVLTPGSLDLAVALAPGAPLRSAEDHAGELKDMLEAAVGRPVTITVQPRHDPLDLYA
jgi:hypothetical protein